MGKILTPSKIHRILNWEEIREKYIYGDIAIDGEYLHQAWQKTPLEYQGIRRFYTYKEISEMYGVTVLQLKAASTKETPSWAVQREQFITKLKQSGRTESEIDKIKESTRSDSGNLKLLNKLSKKLEEFIENLEEVNDDGEEKPINLKDLSLAMDILSKQHKLTRDIYGEPINYEKYASKIIEEKESVQMNAELELKDEKELQKMLSDLESEETQNYKNELQKLIQTGYENPTNT